MQNNNVITSEQEICKYYNLVAEILKENQLEKFLKLDSVKQEDIKQRIEQVQKWYSQLVTIQYKISQIDRNKIAKNQENNKIKIIAIDEQAKNWLDRLSTTLNILTIKMSEFDVKNSLNRDIIIFVISILFTIITIILGICSNRDVKNKAIQADSLILVRHQEYILNFDTLKLQNQQQDSVSGVIINMIDSIKKNRECQNKNMHSSTKQ